MITETHITKQIRTQAPALLMPSLAHRNHINFNTINIAAMPETNLLSVMHNSYMMMFEKLGQAVQLIPNELDIKWLLENFFLKKLFRGYCKNQV